MSAIQFNYFIGIFLIASCFIVLSIVINQRGPEADVVRGFSVVCLLLGLGHLIYAVYLFGVFHSWWLLDLNGMTH